MEGYKGSDDGPPLPSITALHLYDWLMEVGPTEAGGMGSTPLSWREIDAWATRTFTPLSAWEARTLRRLSVAYHAELHAAEDMARPAPWLAPPTEIDHSAEERQLRAVLG